MGLTSLRAALQGKKTHLIVAALLIGVAVEKGLGIDVPGLAIGDDWLEVVLGALGLSTLRAGIATTR